jgi:hypothetical protein
MIIPDRKVPNFWTATRAPVFPAGAAVDALTGSPRGWQGLRLPVPPWGGRGRGRMVTSITGGAIVVNSTQQKSTATQP